MDSFEHRRRGVLSASLALFTISVALGFLLITAGVAKVLAGSRQLAETIMSYKVIPPPAVKILAAAFPPAEIVTGLCLVTGFALSISALSAFLLFSCFAFGIAINLYRGRSHIRCGCFGSRREKPISWSIFARNALLSAASIVLVVVALWDWPMISDGTWAFQDRVSHTDALVVYLTLPGVFLLIALAKAMRNLTREAIPPLPESMERRA